jgi:hypothetical protein
VAVLFISWFLLRVSARLGFKRSHRGLEQRDGRSMFGSKAIALFGRR